MVRARGLFQVFGHLVGAGKDPHLVGTLLQPEIEFPDILSGHVSQFLRHLFRQKLIRIPGKKPTHAERWDEGGQQRKDEDLSLDTIKAKQMKNVRETLF